MQHLIFFCKIYFHALIDYWSQASFKISTNFANKTLQIVWKVKVNSNPKYIYNKPGKLSLKINATIS